MKELLLVFAHPDDESFACALTVAKYVKAGWKVDLMCATRGEAGSPGPYTDATKDKLGAVRQKELETAATLLGINSITFLGYKDGQLASEHPGELEETIYQKMKELIPDCVITFDTTGISNHPDHIKICFATTFAFQKYARFIDDQLKESRDYDPEKAPKLYYACVPQTIVDYLLKKKIFPKESYGRPWRGAPDKNVTTAINGTGFLTVKKKALLAHVTQQDDVNRFLYLTKNPLLKNEYFILRLHGMREIFMGKHDRVAVKL